MINPLRSEQYSVGFRLFSCFFLLVLALIDTLLWRSSAQTFWLYTCFMGLCASLICVLKAIWGQGPTLDARWRRATAQFMHWIAFLALMWLFNELINRGAILPRNAGFLMLGLLGFSLFWSALLNDVWLCVVGAMIVLIAMSRIWTHWHLMLLLLPIFICALFLILLVGHCLQRKSKDAR